MKLAVIGIGNYLLQDEGIGIHLIGDLEKAYLPPNVDCIDGGTGGLALMNILEHYDKALIIDACDMGLEPGQFRFFTTDEVKDIYIDQRITLHDANILDILNLSGLIINVPEIFFLGIEPYSIDFGDSLSPAMLKRKTTILQALQTKITQLCINEEE